MNSSKIGSFRPHWGLVSDEGPKLRSKGGPVESELSKNNFPSQSWNDTLSENRLVQSVLGSSIERGSEIAFKRRSVKSELSKIISEPKVKWLTFRK